MFVFSAIANFIAIVFSIVCRQYFLAVSFLFGFMYSLKIVFLDSRVKTLEKKFDELNKQINPNAQKEYSPYDYDDTPAD